MTLYSFSGGDLNQAGNYNTLNDDGSPVLNNGEPVHPQTVPQGSGVTIQAASTSMFGTTSVGTFQGGQLTSGSITATTFMGGASDGGGSGSATIMATTITGSALAQANGTITATSSITGGTTAAGGTINAAGATVFGSGSSVSAYSGGQITAGTIEGNVLVQSGSSVTTQTLMADPSISGNPVSFNVMGGTGSASALAATAGVVSAYLQVSGGGTLTVASGSAFGVNQGDAVTISVTGAGSTFNSGSNLVLGQNGTATFNASGATVTYGSLDSATMHNASGAASAGYVNISNSSTVTLQGNATIGNADFGSLSIQSGSNVNVGGNFVLANQGTAQGTMTVSGANSALTVTGNATLAQQGTAFSLAVNKGAKLDVHGNLTLAGSTGSSLVYGFVLQDVNTTLHVGGTAKIGDGGTAAFGNYEGAVSTFDGDVIVGNQAGSKGSVVMSRQGQLTNQTNPDSMSIGGFLEVGNLGQGTMSLDSQSTLTVTKAIEVGIGSLGSLTINGSTQSSSGFVGGQNGGTGTITVSGTGASWTATNGLFIGDDGNGTLDIQSGGAVTTSAIDIGHGTTGVGLLQIYDAASNLNVNSAPMRVGDAGQGELDVYSSQSFTAGNVDVAEQAGSKGTIKVANARMTASNLAVGGGQSAGGTGIISLQDLGKFLVTGNLTVWNGGTLAIAAQGTDSTTLVGTAAIIQGSATNLGSISVTNGSLEIDGAVTGTGTIALEGNGLAFLKGSVAQAQTIQFQGANAKLLLGAPLSFSGTISGFARSDIIDLTTIPYNTGSRVQLNGNILIVTPTTGPAIQFTLDPAHLPIGKFVLSADTSAAESGTTDITLSAPATASDFNADNHSDILFRRVSDGLGYLFTMNDATVTNGTTISSQVDNNWQIKGVGDFDGNGTADLLWVYNNAANPSDGLNGISYITLQNGPAATAGSSVVQQLGPEWSVQGVGDFDGDLKADVLYRRSTDGLLYLDAMNGASVDFSKSGFLSQQISDPHWQIAGVADFDGNGTADILWRYDNPSNPSDGLNGVVYEWMMNGTSVTGQNLISSQPGSDKWQVAGTGDFDGNGTADILFRYENTANAGDPLNGFTYIDFMNGTNVSSSSAPTQWQVDNSWSIASIGDYNGDGRSDILFQHSGDGATYIWDMNGVATTSGNFPSMQSGPGWSVQNGALIG